MNAETRFKDFVSRQQRPSDVRDTIDWGRERDDWLAHLDQLYQSISDYLDPFIQRDEITVRHSTIELNEENIGAYRAKRLSIVIGAQEITLTPVGTLLIGSKGRVDVEGSAGYSRLVLVDKDMIDPRSMVRVSVVNDSTSDSPSRSETAQEAKRVEWVWKIVSRPPAMQFIELNKDTLFAMLMEVGND